MSVPTKPAFVHYGTWDDETRAHPAMKWMEEYTHLYDSKAPEEVKNKALAPDHLLVHSTGRKYEGAEASVEAMYNEIYAPFAKWVHIPYHMITYEIDDGWEMMGLATLYWTLAAPGKQESGSKVKDAEGNEWDGATPAAFNFRYRKAAEGIRLAKTEIAADPSAAVSEMLKRGMMKPEDLLK